MGSLLQSYPLYRALVGYREVVLMKDDVMALKDSKHVEFRGANAKSIDYHHRPVAELGDKGTF